MHAHNPYRDSLKGLDIPDPVAAFFAWCREREAIRVKREAGEPPPWSRDPIFQQGRFLNVFREDDKGTQAVLRFAEPVRHDLRNLVHALFFARWCNRHSTLDRMHPRQLHEGTALRRFLLHEVPQPWSSEVYPVVPVMWEGRSRDRLDAGVNLFPCILDFLEDCVRSADGNVMSATRAINARFQMSNDFPIFMALVDLALFRPEVMSPASPVPTGIGAAPFLDRLQAHIGCADHQETAERLIVLQAAHWPEARRRFTPIDIEYLSCECRKYYSYVNGTKRFEGKNLFSPSGVETNRDA